MEQGEDEEEDPGLSQAHEDLMFDQYERCMCSGND